MAKGVERKELLEMNKCRETSFGSWGRIKSRILCCERVDSSILNKINFSYRIWDF